MWKQSLLAVILSAATGAAWGQVDCAKLPEDLQPQCAHVNRMNALCTGLEGDRRKACEHKNMSSSTREDCSLVPLPAQAMCQEHNRVIERIERCRDKTGTEREACIRDNVSRPGMRQL